MSSGNLIKLNENLTVKEVSGFNNSNKTIFDAGVNLSIDVSDLQRIDGAGIQLLCAIVKEANEKNISISWKGESQSLQDAIVQFGLVEIMNYLTGKSA